MVVESKQSEAVAARIAAYGWSQRTLRLFGVGTVANGERFVKALVKQGYSRDFLAEIGLVDNRMFRPECLIYTVRDGQGRPVAFAARFLDYEEQERKLEILKKGFGKESGEYQAGRAKALPKYVSTKDHALYKKGQLLFGMHAAARASRTLYVFEGNSDCVTATSPAPFC